MNPSLFFAFQLWELACQRWRPTRRPTSQLNALIPTVGAGLPAMAAYPPTNSHLNALIPTVGAGLLAKAASQSTNPQLNTLGQIVGAGLPAMAAYKTITLPLNALIPTVGAGLLAKAASQSTNPQLNTLGQIVGAGLPAMAAYKTITLPTECNHSNCGSGLARESGLPDKIKTTEQTPHINIPPQSRLKYTNRYAITATTPCAVTYAYARIRRLTRLWVGLYRFPVTENQ
ncbi:hypothetical protein [Pseudomonas putida]|uniref:hypothetical protein n=1 Tax=Pseudomonas putida TaxID=303 RepID=UPI000FDC0816|nr:hypothetical protein [Pseudomonas putida]